MEVAARRAVPVSPSCCAALLRYSKARVLAGSQVSHRAQKLRRSAALCRVHSAAACSAARSRRRSFGPPAPFFCNVCSALVWRFCHCKRRAGAPRSGAHSAAVPPSHPAPLAPQRRLRAATRRARKLGRTGCEARLVLCAAPPKLGDGCACIRCCAELASVGLGDGDSEQEGSAEHCGRSMESVTFAIVVVYVVVGPCVVVRGAGSGSSAI
mmetsp:Transcript_43227/g.129126  ORF Transcript_43227/g.129126 Transcript_43227/m.129126 type:complete len:211 (-) Transcript_43227:78-710(-)